jgi:perosamine synthetase
MTVMNAVPEIAPPSPNPIPLTRPSAGEAELAAVAEVFCSGWLAGQGPRGTALEAGFARLTRRAHAVALNNCTAALHLALTALGTRPGDEVLVADYSFPATGHAVLYCDATPVFVDVRADTATMDPDLVEAAITPRTRGIVAVDALGMPADWGPLQEIARRHGLYLLADAACSAGGMYAGRPCGSFGDVAVFSLHARKGITCGEGGVLVTDDAAIAERVRRDACFGMESAFARQSADTLPVPTFPALGYNYKLSDVLAAIGAVQLDQLDEFMSRRRVLAGRYAEMLADVPGILAPTTPGDRVSAWQTYAVTVAEPLERDAIAVALRASGIGCNIGTYALHRQEVYGPAVSDCPVSDRLFRRHLALPMYSDLTDADQDRVVETLAKIVYQQ